MSDNTNVKNVNEQEAKEVKAVETKHEEAMPTVQYILEQMAAIQKDNAHVFEALNVLTSIQQVDPEAGAPEDVAGQAKATAIADVVKCRETTNQKLLAFYEKMYDDLKPPKPHKVTALEILSQAVSRNYNDPEPDQIANLAEALSSALDGVRHIDH